MVDYVDALAEALSAEAVTHVLKQAGAGYGVAYASHRILYCDGSATGVSTMPKAWIDHYRRSGYDQLDPGAKRAKGLIGACGNSFETPKPGEVWSPKMQQMNAEIREFHVNGSYFVTHSTPCRGVVSMVNFITDASGAQYAQWISAHGSKLRLLAASAHARLMELSDSLPLIDALSPREREVLRWLADGYRVDRISQKMGLSNRTVEVHLAKARQKLGARTREQALAIAIRSGLFRL